MEEFNNVGIGKCKENLGALMSAHELTNSKAEIFRISYNNDLLEGMIVSVNEQKGCFTLQMIDGSRTEPLDISKLEKIEKLDRWGSLIEAGKSYKIYVDDIRPVPADYIGTKSVNETIALIEEIERKGGFVECLDLDHDLGDFAWLGGDAIKLLDYLIMENKFYRILIHTSNPVGRSNMERTISRYWK